MLLGYRHVSIGCDLPAVKHALDLLYCQLCIVVLEEVLSVPFADRLTLQAANLEQRIIDFCSSHLWRESASERKQLWELLQDEAEGVAADGASGSSAGVAADEGEVALQRRLDLTYMIDQMMRDPHPIPHELKLNLAVANLPKWRLRLIAKNKDLSPEGLQQLLKLWNAWCAS